MNLKAIRWQGVDWIQLVRDKKRWRALVNTVMNLRLPHKTGNHLSDCKYLKKESVPVELDDSATWNQLDSTDFVKSNYSINLYKFCIKYLDKTYKN
jgi:hypothetical protein